MNENNTSLLSRLSAKFNDIVKGKTVRFFKTLATVMASAVIAASVVTITGCNGFSIVPDDDSSYTDDTDKNNNSFGGDANDKTNNCSDILYTILTDSKYLNVNESFKTSERLLQMYKPIPFGLSDSDFNSSDIYNDNQTAYCYPYFKNGDTSKIYLSLRVTTETSSFSYYTFYTLSYPLTEMEYNELVKYFESKSLICLLFIQELSYQKTPTLVSKAKINTATHKLLLSYIKKHDEYSTDVFGTNDLDMELVGFNVDSENGNFTLNIFKNSYSALDIVDCRTVTLTQYSNDLSYRVQTSETDPDVMCGPSTYFIITDEDYEDYISNMDERTYYYRADVKAYDASAILNKLNK